MGLYQATCRLFDSSMGNQLSFNPNGLSRRFTVPGVGLCRGMACRHHASINAD